VTDGERSESSDRLSECDLLNERMSTLMSERLNK
jgi:hypothetical protein